MPTRAEKYRRDAEQCAYQRDSYIRTRSKWGQEQFARYARLSAQALDKMLAYLSEDAEAIAAIERDDERVLGRVDKTVWGRDEELPGGYASKVTKHKLTEAEAVGAVA
mgnify:CR=1 FL=1